MMLKKVTIFGLPGFRHHTSNSVEFDRFGKITSLVGANSSGKTTLLKVIENILTFFLAGEFDRITETEDTWIQWSAAEIIFDTSSLVENEVPPLGDTVGGRSKTIKFILKKHPNNSKQTLISLIETDNGILELIDFKNIYLENPRVKKTTEEINVLLNNVTDRETDLTAYNNNPRHSVAIQTTTKKIEEAKVLILEKQKEKTLQQIELINFVKKPLNILVEVSRTSLKEFLKKLGFKHVHYISYGRNAIDSVEKMIVEAIKSKSDRRSYLHESIVNDLSYLLEIKVELYLDKNTNKNILLIGGKDYNKISHGAQICLYYYSYIYSSVKNSIVIWDEPENGLHSTRKYKLFELFKTDPRYFIIATHSSELCPVLDSACEVYRTYSEYNEAEKIDEVELNLVRATTRRDAFKIIEDLGITASKVLFTSNLVIWVEGPSDLYFFRHWLNILAKDEGLVEGFDYTFMFFGGTLLSHFEINEIAIGNFTKDILSINKNFAFLIDSDLKEPQKTNNPSDWLKPATKRIFEAVTELNILKKNNAAFFQYSKGREVENYLPNKAISYAVENIYKYTKEDLTTLRLESFELNQYSKYYQALEEHFKEKNILSNREGNAPKGISKWGENNKTEFMKKALECPDLKISELNWDGEDQIKKLLTWIKTSKIKNNF